MTVPALAAIGLLIFGPGLLRWSLATVFCYIAPGRRRATVDLKYPLSYECEVCKTRLRWHVSVCPECGGLRLWPIGMAAVQASYAGGVAVYLRLNEGPAVLWWVPFASSALAILGLAVIAAEITRAVSRAAGPRRRSQREIADFLNGRESRPESEPQGVGAPRVVSTLLVIVLMVTAVILMIRSLPAEALLVAAAAWLVSFVVHKSTVVRHSGDPLARPSRLTHVQFEHWASSTLAFAHSRRSSEVLLNPSVPVEMKLRIQADLRRALSHKNAGWMSPVMLGGVVAALVAQDIEPAFFGWAPSWLVAAVVGALSGGACGRFWRRQRLLYQAWRQSVSTGK
jgi:hypothetical protein